MTLSKFLPFHIKEWYETLEKKGVSADLRNKCGQLLRRCLDTAVGRHFTRNPAREIKLPRVTKEEKRPLAEDEVLTFLSEARRSAKNHYVLFLMALDTGARQGELLALEWPDIDLTAGIVRITKTVQLHNGRHRVKEVKTKASRRTLRLTPATLEALRHHKPKAPRNCRLVFPTRNGTYIQRAVLRKSLRRTLARADLPMIRFHDLRHTHATLALSKTKNVKAVSTRLGHDDIRVTLNTYAHWLPTMEEEIVTAWDAILTAPAPERSLPTGSDEPSSSPSPVSAPVMHHEAVEEPAA